MLLVKTGYEVCKNSQYYLCRFSVTLKLCSKIQSLFKGIYIHVHTNTPRMYDWYLCIFISLEILISFNI